MWAQHPNIEIVGTSNVLTLVTQSTCSGRRTSYLLQTASFWLVVAMVANCMETLSDATRV